MLLSATPLFVVGMGAVCRDRSKTWREGFYGKLTYNDPTRAELLAIIEAIAWSKERDWKDCIILSNSMIAVDNINAAARIKCGILT